MVNIFRMQYDMDNRLSALKTTRVFVRVSKFDELWSTNDLKRTGNFTCPP